MFQEQPRNIKQGNWDKSPGWGKQGVCGLNPDLWRHGTGQGLVAAPTIMLLRSPPRSRGEGPSARPMLGEAQAFASPAQLPAPGPKRGPAAILVEAPAPRGFLCPSGGGCGLELRCFWQPGSGVSALGLGPTLRGV